MTKILIFLILLSLSLYVHAGTFKEYYQEAETIVKSMTLDEKIGQTIQLDFAGLTQNN